MTFVYSIQSPFQILLNGMQTERRESQVYYRRPDASQCGETFRSATKHLQKVYKSRLYTRFVQKFVYKCKIVLLFINI